MTYDMDAMKQRYEEAQKHVRTRNSFNLEPFTEEALREFDNYICTIWEDCPLKTNGGICILTVGQLRAIVHQAMKTAPEEK